MAIPAPKGRGYRFGVFELDSETQELRKRGLRIKLGGQSVQILTLLLAHSGEVMSRDQLRKAVWPDETWGDHDQRLNKAMNKIREALGDSADNPRYLETLPRVGYRFLVPAAPLTETPAERVVEAAPAEPSAVGAIGSRLGSVGVILGGGFGLLLLASAGYWVTRGTTPAPVTEPLVSRPLTTFVGMEQSPSFSPDGGRIVYVGTSEEGDRQDLYVLSTGTGGTAKLTDDPQRDSTPAWSPDGKWIAFRKDEMEGRRRAYWLLHPDGSGARKLADADVAAESGGIAWSPDSQWILTPDRAGTGTASLYAISIENGERRRVSTPPGERSDSSPAVSPDGRRLAFVRQTARQWSDLFVADLDTDLRVSGDLRRVTWSQMMIDTPVWTADGKEIVFSAATPSGGAPHLYRVTIEGGTFRDLGGVRIEGRSPTISRDGKRLVYSRRMVEPTTIQQVDLGDPSGPKVRPLITSTSRDYSPSFSPDGREAVMSSGRDGTPQLWLFRADGSDLRQLTFLGNAGASVPQWSPDGRFISFDSRPEGRSDVHVIELATAKIRRLTSFEAGASRSSWSRDGQTIYFGRLEGESSQIWKMPRGGGEPVQLTHTGGLFALESPDRRWLYFSGPEDKTHIKRMPLGGGTEEMVTDNALGRSAFALGSEGMYYLGAPSTRGQSALFFLRYGRAAPSLLLPISRPVHNAITLSRDERRLLFTQIERSETDLMLVENFR